MAERPDEKARCAVDLDGVLTLGSGKGPNDFAPIRPGATDFLKELHERYEEVYIHTARNTDAAKNWLRQNGLLKYVTSVSNTKLPAKVYIDDRAIQFKGNYKKTLREIQDFKPPAHAGESNGSSERAAPVDHPPDQEDQGKAVSPPQGSPE